jgi:hypothetical protein
MTYDASLSQHVQLTCVTLAYVMPRKATASLCRLPARGERRSSLRTQFFRKKLFTNKYGRTRLLRHHLLHSVPSISENKKIPKLLRLGAFALHTIFDFYQRAVVHFLILGPILPLGTAFAHF